MRRQRPRGATRREAVIDAALRLVDQVGVEGLTIRAVAGLVGAPPMSLYTHFTNKEGLLDLMYQEIARRLYRDSGQPTWQQELSALTSHVRSTILAHPRWRPLLTRPAAPPSAPVRERMLELMVAGGMNTEYALDCLSSAILTTFGLTFVELAVRDPDDSSLLRRLQSVKTRRAEARQALGEPITSSAFAVPDFDLEGTFRHSLASLIEGFVLGQHAHRAE
jgi:TetR/AcrR family tetracycline transcriptional repressor